MMNVVVIDNDAPLLKSLEILLGDRGYSVQSFSIAQEGYSYIERLYQVLGNCPEGSKNQ